MNIFNMFIRKISPVTCIDYCSLLLPSCRQHSYQMLTAHSNSNSHTW